MSDAKKHIKAFQEGIMRAKFIRQDLAKTLTEYEPEKVRGLNKAYIETIKEIIRQGDLFIDSTEDFEVGLKVAITIENYRSFLGSLNYGDE